MSVEYLRFGHRKHEMWDWVKSDPMLSVIQYSEIHSTQCLTFRLQWSLRLFTTRGFNQNGTISKENQFCGTKTKTKNNPVIVYNPYQLKYDTSLHPNLAHTHTNKGDVSVCVDIHRTSVAKNRLTKCLAVVREKLASPRNKPNRNPIEFATKWRQIALRSKCGCYWLRQKKTEAKKFITEKKG